MFFRLHFSDGKSRDSRRDRVESSTSRATARSSLHLMVSDPQYSYHQQAAFLRGYNEKPLHLFDAMRYAVLISDFLLNLQNIIPLRIR